MSAQCWVVWRQAGLCTSTQMPIARLSGSTCERVGPASSHHISRLRPPNTEPRKRRRWGPARSQSPVCRCLGICSSVRGRLDTKGKGVRLEGDLTFSAPGSVGNTGRGGGRGAISDLRLLALPPADFLKSCCLRARCEDQKVQLDKATLPSVDGFRWDSAPVGILMVSQLCRAEGQADCSAGPQQLVGR